MSLKPPTRATATLPQPGRRRSSQPLLMAEAAAAVSRRPLRIVTRRTRPRAALLGPGAASSLCTKYIYLLASGFQAASCLCGLAYKCGPRLHHCATAKEYCVFPYRRAPLSTRAARQPCEMNVHISWCLLSCLALSDAAGATGRRLGYVMDNINIYTARDAWLADSAAAEAASATSRRGRLGG